MADSYIDFGVDVGGEVVALTQTDGIFDNLTLNYSSTDHLGVIITNGTTLIQTVLTSEQFTVDTTGSLKITLDFDEIDEYSVLAATDMVRITRTTPTSELERTFTDGSVLKASDLNTQHKQLLYGIQERGPGQITLDTDGKLDAAAGLVGGVATQIKNVALPVNDDEVVTKAYVDNLQIYGTAFGATDPQYWAFTTGDDEVGSDRVYTLASPVPSSEVDNMYLVEIGGVIQSPATYVVSVSGENYTLTLVGGADPAIPDGVAIAVRNFGASRNVVSQPYVNALDTTVALQVRRKSATTSAELQEWQNEGGTPMAAIDFDGTLYLGKRGTTAWGAGSNIKISSGWDEGVFDANGIEIELGDHSNPGDTAGLRLGRSGESTAQFSRLLMSAKSGVIPSSAMIKANVLGDAVFRVSWDGDIITDGSLDVDRITVTRGSGATQGIRSDEPSDVGGIVFPSSGPVVSGGDGKYLQAQIDKVLVVGDLETSAGDLTVDGDITAEKGNFSKEVTVALGNGAGIISNNETTNPGRFYHSTDGPAMGFTVGGAGPTGGTHPRFIVDSDRFRFHDGYLQVEGHLSVNKTTAPEAPLDIAHDGSVPSIGGLVLSTPTYKEYHYKWDKGDIATLDKLTTTLTCPSYFSAEIIFTQHQTNSGQNNLYFKAFWNNSHWNHYLDILSGSVTNETGSQGASNDLPSWTGEIAGIGATGAMTTKLSLSHDPDTAQTGDIAPYNSGKLVIEEDYTASGSYSFSTLQVRVYSGELVTPTHVRTDT